MERKKTENEIKYFLRKRKEVPINTLLIGINLLVFLLVEVTGSSLDTYHILRWGGCYTPAVLQSHEYYRLISSMFLHFGIQHLGNNMLVLLSMVMIGALIGLLVKSGAARAFANYLGHRVNTKKEPASWQVSSELCF